MCCYGDVGGEWLDDDADFLWDATRMDNQIDGKKLFATVSFDFYPHAIYIAWKHFLAFHNTLNWLSVTNLIPFLWFSHSL